MADTRSTSEVFGGLPIPEPVYPDIKNRSFYLTMRDGVKIAVDLTLPKGLPAAEKIPALLVQTRYWRSREFRVPFKWFIPNGSMTPKEMDARYFFGQRGYAILNMDVRGTGASYGTLKHPWPPESIEDAREVIDWMITQPWSNGSVGAFGVSYPGTCAEMLAVLQHPAMKVVIPKFNHPDSYLDIAFPGGLFNKRFIKYWGYFDKVLDKNIVPDEFGRVGKALMCGVKPVDDDRSRKQLKEAVKQHAENRPVFDVAQQLTYRDEIHPESGVSIQDMVVHRYEQQVKSSPTFIHGWGSWLDAGTGDAVIRRFLTFKNAGRAVIGAWDHGGMQHASPFLPPGVPVSPAYPIQMTEMLRVFDAFLKEEQNGVREERALYYYTMGEERWKVTSVWPPQGVHNQRWYFCADHHLDAQPPTEETGMDAYRVDFSVTSGNYNRWWEMGIMDKKSVEYPDRADLAEKVLSYTSAPLERDVEITGHPMLNLFAASTEADTAFYVYLEDVAPDGRVTYITEGLLRSIHRNVSTETPTYQIPIPQRTYKQADACPLVPGEPALLQFGMFATSVLVRKGHCIRVSIAGHDEGTFPRIPAEGTPEISVYRSRLQPSSIDLPVIEL